MKNPWRDTLEQAIQERYIQHADEWYHTILSTWPSVDITIVSWRFDGISADFPLSPCCWRLIKH